MNDLEILERIQKIYIRVLGDKDTILMPEMDFIASKEISSFIKMEFIAEIEDEFNIELTYSSIQPIRKISELMELIKNQMNLYFRV